MSAVLTDAQLPAAYSPLRLPLALYRLHFIAQEAVRLPAYAGSAWRGVFGHALKRLVCVTREPACPACLLYRSCVYPYLFETPPDPAAGKLRKYPAAPHPYLLRPGPGGMHAAGATVQVDVALFGHGNRHLPLYCVSVGVVHDRTAPMRGDRMPYPPWSDRSRRVDDAPVFTLNSLARNRTVSSARLGREPAFTR